MIDFFRYLLALALFLLGIYLVIDLFLTGFSFVVLVGAIVCFILAHYLRPGRDPREDVSAIVDLLDVLVDLPFRLVAGILRWVGRLFKGDLDVGID